MAFGKRTLRINTMYGADGRLRTSYLEGKAAMAAKKNVKAFNRELARYEKDFTNYASLDINAANISNTNTRFIFGKLNIAEKYVDYIPAGDMAESMGDDMTAVAGNRSAYRLGIGSKIAGVFQPFLEKQAKKHPKLQALSDNITKAANGGRMPLTADSAAIMKIAFDKKYYYDCRRPGADKDALKEQYISAMNNLMTMAEADGVSAKAMSAKVSEKLITQMQIDESLTDIYAGMSTGEIRLGEDKPMLNAKGEEIKIKGKTLYQRTDSFVDPNGNEINALSLTPREPQTIDEILEDYQMKLDKYVKSCKTEADFKKMLASDSYQNIERNAKVFAALDCPDEAEKFKYEFARVNIESCRNWALENDNKSPYAQLVVPPKFDEVTAGNDFVRGYSTSDYYNIDGIEDDYYTTRDISEKAQEETLHMSDDELADSLKSDITDSHEKLSDIEKLQARLDALEAENRELRELLYSEETSAEKEKADEMLHSTGLQSPKENTSISFDNNIVHSAANVKDSEQNSLVTDKESILRMAEKIQKNENEDNAFREQISRFFDKSLKQYESVTLGSTPLILKELGSEAPVLIVSQETLNNATKETGDAVGKHTSGHNIPYDAIYNLSQKVREPILVLRGNSSNPNSVVLLTELENKDNGKIIVPISLDRKNGSVNIVNTLYAKDNVLDENGQIDVKQSLHNYLHNHENELLAVDTKKAEKLYKDIGLQLPSLNTVICFNDSIAYSTANVKYPEQNISEPTAEEYAADKNARPESQPVDGQTVHTSDDNKSDYSLFRIEHMGEVAYFRDKGVDIDAFVKRFTEMEEKMPGKYAEFTKDSENISESEYAGLDQSRKNPPAFTADINLDDRDFAVHKGNQFTMASLDEIIENVKNTGNTNLSFETVNYEEIPENEISSDDTSFDEALMNNGEIEIIEPEAVSESKTLAMMYYNKYESGDQSWHDTGTLTVNNNVFTLHTHNGYTGAENDSVITRQEAEAILNKAAAREDDHFLTDDGREFYENEHIAETQINRETAEVSTVNVPDNIAETASPEEKSDEIEKQSETQKRTSVGYISVKDNESKVAAHRQSINEQFGSSGKAIMPSGFGKRDYTVKPVEVSDEINDSKYSVDDKQAVSEEHIESTFEQDVETSVETGITETSAETEPQSFIDSEFEEVEDDTNVEELFDNTSSDSKPASTTSKFSDSDFSDFDDYEDENFDDEDFSP